MYAETKESRTHDLRTGGTVSLAVHAALILILGIAVTHSRARFTPPALQTIRLDVDLPPSVAADTAVVTPSASPVQAAAPQLAAPPRPTLSAQNEERLAPATAPLDMAPAAEDSVASLSSPAGGVTTFVATESTTGKNIFGTGVDGVLDALPTGRPASSGHSGSGVGIEGPISLRRDMKPLYPLGARQRGEEGTVVLEAVVDTDGRAASVTVV